MSVQATLRDAPVFMTNLNTVLDIALDILHEADRNNSAVGDIDRVISLLTFSRDLCEKTVIEIEKGPDYHQGVPSRQPLEALISAHLKALADYDANPGDKGPEVKRLRTIVTETRLALLDHRPFNIAEVSRKSTFMASCRTFVEWDDFDQVKLIEALTPASVANART
jgi:hypothetical protein